MTEATSGTTRITTRGIAYDSDGKALTGGAAGQGCRSSRRQRHRLLARDRDLTVHVERERDVAELGGRGAPGIVVCHQAWGSASMPGSATQQGEANVAGRHPRRPSEKLIEIDHLPGRAEAECLLTRCYYRWLSRSALHHGRHPDLIPGRSA
jgi:hypothetical protein